MKKILSALTLTCLALGVVSAEPKFSLNYRTQMVGFSRLVGSPDLADENTNYLLQQIKGYQSASDTVSVSASTDYAGVTVRIDPVMDSETSPSLQLNQYNGWVKVGNVEIGAGTWKDGKANSQYLLKNDSDAGNYNGDVFGAVKLGSLFGGAMTLNIGDMVNFAGGDRASSAYASWKGEVGGAKLTVTGSLIGANGTSMTWDEEETICTGFGLNINAAFSGAEAQFIFKTASNKVTDSGLGEQRAFGFYVMPELDFASLVIGGSVGLNNSNLSEANLDLRLRKELEESGTNITFYTNVSHITNQCDYITDISKHLGAYYLGSDGKMATASNAFTGVHGTQTYATVMWNMLALRQKLAKGVYFLCTAGDNVSLDNLGKDTWTGLEAFVAPGVQFMAGKSSIVSYCRVGMSNIGVDGYGFGDDDKENELSVLVPVIVRVRF